jgi:hypothetical protein
MTEPIMYGVPLDWGKPIQEIRVFVDSEDSWRIEAADTVILLGEDWEKFPISTPESLARFKAALDKAAELLGWPK